MGRIYGKDTLNSLDLVANLAIQIIHNRSIGESVRLSDDSIDLLSNGYLFLYNQLQELATIPSVSSQKLFTLH